MKGKGKKGRDSSEDECPLQFLDFEPLDVIRFCPRFNSVMTRSEEEGVGLEDLDALQTEIELMLVNVTRRSIAIDSEVDTLTNWQESQCKPHRDKKSSPSKTSSETPSKRKARSEPDDGRPVKKALKDSSCSSMSSSASTISSASSNIPAKSSQTKSKSKNIATKIQPLDYDHSAPRNDIPDRFLQFIQPYCAPVRPENIKMLEDIIKSYDDIDSEYMKVPNLGKHYTSKWSVKTDTLAESIDATARGPPSKSSKKTKETKVKGKKKGGKKDDSVDEKGSFGILTQRLLQSLLEDPSETSEPDSPGTDEKHSLTNGSVLKTLSLGNTAQLEKRIKKELEETGLLDTLFDDPAESQTSSRRTSSGDDEDEILRELIRAQKELKTVSAQNLSSFKCLLSSAKVDIARQEIQGKLEAADEEVVDAYKKLMTAKSKKKAMTKKEKDACLKALKDRDVLVKQLDALLCTSS